jgi:hypothetical protein
MHPRSLKACCLGQKPASVGLEPGTFQHLHGPIRSVQHLLSCPLAFQITCLIATGGP